MHDATRFLPLVALTVWSCSDTEARSASIQVMSTDTGSTSPSESDTPSATVDTGPVIPPEPPELPPPTGDPCVDGVILSALIDLIVDPDPVGCPWGVGDNLGESQGLMAARDEVTARLVRVDNGKPVDWLEEGGHLCDLRLDSVDLDEQPMAADFVYDDLLIVTLNDIVLLASAAPVLDELNNTNDLYLFDWSQLRGKGMFFQQPSAYCMDYGQDSECALPASDTTGEFLLSFKGATVEKVRKDAIANQTLELKFITVGDNDEDTDCRHNGFRMRAMIEVALPGSF